MIPSPSPATPFHQPAPAALQLPGREAELAQLGAVIERARSGTPQWVAIEGPPGMGKTPLVDAALPSLADWRQVVIELDPADSPTPGTLLRHLLTGLTGQRSVTVPDSVPECVRTVLEMVDASEGCTALVIENLQWADAWSTEVLWHVARGFTHGRSLVLLTYRPHRGDLPPRIDRFLESGRRGLKLTLGPVSQAACRQLLQDRLGVPVSDDIARRVHQGTGGVPFQVDAVAEWMLTAPPAQRSLPEALAAVTGDRPGSVRSFDQTVLSSIEELPEAARTAVQLLAVAGHALPLPELDRALDRLGQRPVSGDLLPDTELLQVDPGTGDVALTTPHLASLITRQLTAETRAGLHRALASVLTGPLGLQHRVRAHRLSPRPADQDGLLAEVTARGVDALGRQDGVQAFEHFQHALWLSADTRMLALALKAMVQARRPELVQGVRDPLRRLPPSRPRHAGQAWVWLATDNVEAALVHVLSGLDLPEEDPDRSGLVLLAHVLNATGHAALVKGRLDLMAAPAQALLSQLRPLRLQLEQEVRLDGGARALLVEVQSLEAELALWSAGDHGDHTASGLHTSGMRMLLDELAAVPGTEVAQAGIGSVVGWGLLAQGEVAEAHRVLRGAAAADPADRTLSVRVHTGLGRLAFQAGDWDTAQAHFERAVENCLLLPTTATARAAFASAAMVPLARGDQTAGERLLARAQDEGIDAGDLVTGTVALSRGIGALFAGEHRQAVRHFTVLDGGHPGLRTAGVTGMVLHARELALTGAADRLECLAASVDDDAAAAPPAVRRAVRDAVTGFLAVAHGDLDQARQQLASCLDALDGDADAPATGLHPVISSASLPGGGHALVRAFVALDAAGVVHQLPGAAEWDEQALGWARQAAETFLRTDARRQHAEAVRVMGALRRRLALAHRAAGPAWLEPTDGAAGSAPPGPASAAVTVTTPVATVAAAPGRSRAGGASSAGTPGPQAPTPGPQAATASSTEALSAAVTETAPVPAAGFAPRPVRESGVGAPEAVRVAVRKLAALSAREREIALEVAQGKSNREIAAEMYLSVRTVEFHVGNCLSKLGLANRVDLRRALRAAIAHETAVLSA